MGWVKKIHITFLQVQIIGIARVLWSTFILNWKIALWFTKKNNFHQIHIFIDDNWFNSMYLIILITYDHYGPTSIDEAG